MMYSHDGIRDSLTQLAAPTLLYLELSRELARASREKQPVSLIRFLIVPGCLGHYDDDAVYKNLDEIVLHFAQTLAQLSRSDEICARVGELEFVCTLHGPEDAIRSFISRISLQWRKVESSPHRWQSGGHVNIEAAALVSTADEGALAFLNRLDLAPTIAL